METKLKFVLITSTRTKFASGRSIYAQDLESTLYDFGGCGTLIPLAFRVFGRLLQIAIRLSLPATFPNKKLSEYIASEPTASEKLIALSKQIQSDKANVSKVAEKSIV
jgi:hypothetical protein